MHIFIRIHKNAYKYTFLCDKYANTRKGDRIIDHLLLLLICKSG